MRGWLEGLGCDALLLHNRTFDPLMYAGVWNREHRESRPEVFARAIERWLGYYRREGIEASGRGC